MPSRRHPAPCRMPADTSAAGRRAAETFAQAFNAERAALARLATGPGAAAVPEGARASIACQSAGTCRCRQCNGIPRRRDPRPADGSLTVDATALEAAYATNLMQSPRRSVARTRRRGDCDRQLGSNGASALRVQSEHPSAAARNPPGNVRVRADESQRAVEPSARHATVWRRRCRCLSRYLRPLVFSPFGILLPPVFCGRRTLALSQCGARRGTKQRARSNQRTAQVDERRCRSPPCRCWGAGAPASGVSRSLIAGAELTTGGSGRPSAGWKDRRREADRRIPRSGNPLVEWDVWCRKPDGNSLQDHEH